MPLLIYIADHDLDQHVYCRGYAVSIVVALTACKESLKRGSYVVVPDENSLRRLNSLILLYTNFVITTDNQHLNQCKSFATDSSYIFLSAR